MQKEKREEIIETTNMVIKLCLMSGTKLETAYKVGAEFASGLERELEIKGCKHPNLTPAKGGGFRCEDCHQYVTRLAAKERTKHA